VLVLTFRRKRRLANDYWDYYSQFLRRIDFLRTKFIRRTPPIKIAILGTGVHSESLIAYNVYGNFKECKSWVEPTASVEDYHGHGTHVVQLTDQFAPESSIFIAKVSDSNQRDNDFPQKVAEVCLTVISSKSAKGC
jgi:hypothetical protein